MSRRKINITYLFLFIIPYFTAVYAIGTSYDVMVNHWDNWWRLIVGGLVGACLMTLLKIVIQRPLSLLFLQNKKTLVAIIGRYFVFTGDRRLAIINFIVDFILSIAAIFVTRLYLPMSLIMVTAIGWPIMILFISTAIGSYLAYDILSIDPEQR